MKNKTLLDSIKCAINGLWYGLKTEKNFKYYFGIALIFLIINLICKVGIQEHISFIIVCGGVFATEFLNTAIEHLCNIFTKQENYDIKIIKDISATGVLIWGFVFFIMEFLIIGSHLL